MSKFNIGDLVEIIECKGSTSCYQYSDIFDETLLTRLDEFYGKVGKITDIEHTYVGARYSVKLNDVLNPIKIYEDNLETTSHFEVKQRIATPEPYRIDWDKLSKDLKNNDGYIDKECKEGWNKSMNRSILEMWRERSLSNLRKMKKRIEEEIIRQDPFNLIVEDNITNVLFNANELSVQIGDKPKIMIMINDMDAHECITKDTQSKIEQIKKVYEKEAVMIDEKKREINAMIQDCDTYEQSMSVLEAYGIVKQNMLNPRTYDKTFFAIDE